MGKKKPAKFPNQPLVTGDDGVIRFRENRIISKLVEVARKSGFGLNEIAIDLARNCYEPWESAQLTQLIGYSVSGWGDLPVVQENYSKRLAKLDKKVNKLSGKWEEKQRVEEPAEDASSVDMDRCPVCDSPSEGSCRCPRSDSSCANGHEWHLCFPCHKIVLSGSDHKLDITACTCL